MSSTSALQPLLHSPCLLHPHILPCWSIPSPPTPQNTDAPKRTSHIHAGTTPEQQHQILLGTGEVFPASLLHSPGKHTWKRQPGRARTTRGELCANSFPCSAGAAIRLPGVFEVSVQKMQLALPRISACSDSTAVLLNKNMQKAKNKKTTQTSPSDGAQEGLTAPTGHLIPPHVYC